MPSTTFAPGARVCIRDAEWIVRRVDRTSSGGQALACVGISELVKDRESIFLTELEADITHLDPAATDLVQDLSPNFLHTRLFIESLLRQTPPTDAKIVAGHRAAMDVLPYQLEPTTRALNEPRQRILIADAVGLGKTLEAGILMTELIRRGRGKRILVLTLKSMMTQFQKEMWSRFSIPLVRLDSVGIQRVKHKIPTNHNPFAYFDKAIISIDTLKQDVEYRTSLEKCRWDIIVIDEAHNVAQRGTNSQRSRLAKLLAQHSDSLIMLSATPHDGKAESFASLMNMLDPTAIADVSDYGPADIQGLCVRRFKKDIKDQVQQEFKERTIVKHRVKASAAEEAAYEVLSGMQFRRIQDQQRGNGSMLFRTTLEKALFSSPAACLKTIDNRCAKLQKEQAEKPVDGTLHDLEALSSLQESLAAIAPADFSKYRKLLELIKSKDFAWTSKEPGDRLVIFTESLVSLDFLRQQLASDLKLKDNAFDVLHGGLSDIDQQRIVEDFGNAESPLRLLLASDVASEGINLHYQCHRLIHFDLPWSLMVFQQRNGRVDRYGQEHEPQIHYLLTESANDKIRGDLRILELLIEKDEQANKNIGDPAAFLGVYDADLEVAKVASAIEAGLSPEAFTASVAKADDDAIDMLALLLGHEESPAAPKEDVTRSLPSLFRDDYSFAKEAINFVRGKSKLECSFDDARQTLNLTAPTELQRRLRKYFDPNESSSDRYTFVPRGGEFALSANIADIKREIARARTREDSWPRIHLLWEMHPVLTWLSDKAQCAFSRHQAPALTLPSLPNGDALFLISGLIPNRQGHPVVNRFFGIRFSQGKFSASLDLDQVLALTQIGTKSFSNRGETFDLKPLQSLLPDAVKAALSEISRCRNDYETQMQPRLLGIYERLKDLKKRRLGSAERQYLLPGLPAHLTSANQQRFEESSREVEKIFKAHQDWVRDTMTTENSPYLRVVAVFAGEG